MALSPVDLTRSAYEQGPLARMAGEFGMALLTQQGTGKAAVIAKIKSNVNGTWPVVAVGGNIERLKKLEFRPEKLFGMARKSSRGIWS